MQDNTLFASKFNINKSENEDYSWGNWTFQQYEFVKDNRLTYGVYSGGVYAKNDIRVNSWGLIFHGANLYGEIGFLCKMILTFLIILMMILSIN